MRALLQGLQARLAHLWCLVGMLVQNIPVETNFGSSEALRLVNLLPAPPAILITFLQPRAKGEELSKWRISQACQTQYEGREPMVGGQRAHLNSS